jgi:GWxTD domain-containing protein
MNGRKRRWAALLLCLGLSAGYAGPPANNPLPVRYQKWLDEEVVYIITPREREVFLKLQTDRERDIFIEAFWAHRDPTPNTPENEFKTEHYRRIAYANHQFGRVSPLPGWKTDRGRMYIILGEPNSIERFEGRTDIVPAEVWFYQDKSALGLPAGFNLVFYQEAGMGDFHLYSPAQVGPQGLIRDYHGRPNDYEGAYTTLKEYEPDLASVSLSLIPGDSSVSQGRPSLSSDLFLHKIEILPQTRVKDDYAQKFFDYKDIVDIEYSAHYLGSDALVAVARNEAGDWIVHYVLEPERLSVSGYGRTYQTTFVVNGIVTDPAGTVVHQFERTFAVKMDEGRMDDLSRRPFDLRDIFPLIPGTYKVSVLAKNTESKEFTSFERSLVIPGDEPRPLLTRPLLAYHWTRQAPDSGKLIPFEFGPFQLDLQPGRVFTRGDTLAAAFQVFGASPDARQAGLIRFEILKDGQAVVERSRDLRECPDLPNVLEEFPLGSLAPAHYALKVALVFSGQVSVAAEEEFDLTFRDSVPRPWAHAKVVPGPGTVGYEQTLGAELFNAGRFAEARVRLEKAYRKDPASSDSAVLLAQTFLALEDIPRAASTLAPFLETSQTPSYDLLMVAGRVRQRQHDYAGALDVYERAIASFGLNAVLLNAVGDCAFALGRLDRALAAWQKSLEISPSQPEIRKKVEELKSKH